MLNDGFAGDLTSSQLKLSGTVVEASERMIRLINDLLAITRIQNSHSHTRTQTVMLSSLLRKIENELHPSMQRKDLQFETSLGNAHSITSDESYLHEMLSNLIVNAIQYPPSRGKITVTMVRDGNKLRIAVIDTGIGIPKKYITTMFDQFTRADNALLEHPAGTGLGLYIVKLLADKLGATIDCQSTVGRGTTFIVSVPTGTTL